MLSWFKSKKDIPSSPMPVTRLHTGKENRLAIRKRQKRMAGVIFSARTFTKKCVIKDISATGAHIYLDTTAMNFPSIKGTMSIYIFTEKQEIDCQVVWQAGRSVGIRFVGAYRAPSRSFDDM